MTGTIINIITVTAGSVLGLLLRNKLPDKFKTVILQAIGLMTIVIGMQMALKTNDILVLLLSLLSGALTGQFLHIDLSLEKFADLVKNRFLKNQDGFFSEGLITASIIFCVGPMTILGSFNDGLRGDYELLAIKSVLDGFTSIALAASFGIGVLFSVFTILIIQGGLTFFAGFMEKFLNDLIVNEMTAIGGVLIIGIGLVILDIKKIKIANFLPALVFVPLFLMLKDLFMP